jgi:hypothetical protein
LSSNTQHSDFVDQIRIWFEDRRPRVGAWHELSVSELQSVPSFGGSAPRRRFDLRFRFGPLSYEYPTIGARQSAEALPAYVEAVIGDGVLDSRVRAHSGSPRFEESADEDGHVTIVVVVPLTVGV